MKKLKEIIIKIFKLKVFILVFCLCTLNSSFCQISKSKVLYDDSILLDQSVPFYKYILLGNKNILALNQKGIFIPDRNLWYYQTDSLENLFDFSFNIFDTSFYFLSKKKEKASVYKIGLSTKYFYLSDTIKFLFQLPDTNLKRIFTFDKGMFYLLRYDTSSTVYLYDGEKFSILLKSKERVYNIIPLGNNTFIGTFKNSVFYFQKGVKIKELFNDGSKIYSVVISNNGDLYVGTSNGIFILGDKNKITLIDDIIKDSRLAFFKNILYVYSPLRRIVYMRYVMN